MQSHLACHRGISLVCLFGFISLMSACSLPLPYVTQTSPKESARTTFVARRLDGQALKQFVESTGRVLPAEQQAWDFETLALVAQFYSPDMAVSEARWREAIATSGLALNPKAIQLDFLSEHHSITESSRPSPWSWGIGFEFVLPDADRRAAKIQLGTDQVALARLDVASSSWQARSLLRRHWIEYFAAQEREGLSTELLEISRKYAAQIQHRVEAGLQGQGDLRIAQDIQKWAEHEQADAHRKFLNQQAQLRSSLHLPPDTLQIPVLLPMSWEALYKKIADLPKDQLQEMALNNRLDLKTAEARYAIADAKLRLEVAQQYPEISLKPGYEWDQGDHRLKLGFGLSIVLPAAHQAAIDAASAERDTQGKVLLARQEEILQELSRACLEWIAARERIQELKSNQHAMERARDQIQLGIRLGEVDPLMGFEAEQKVINAKTQTLEAEMALQKTTAQLEDVLQQPITLILVKGLQ